MRPISIYTSGGNPRDSCSLLLTYPNSPRPPAATATPRPFRANVFRSSPFSRSFSAPVHLRGGKEACPREKRVCAFLRVNAPPRGGYAALVFSLFLSMPHPQALSSPGRISLSSSSNPRYSFTYVRAIYRLRQRARIPIRESGEFSRKRGLLFLFARRHAPDRTRRYQVVPPALKLSTEASLYMYRFR